MQLSGCITNIIVQSTEEQSKSLRFKAQWKLLTSKRTAPSQKTPLLKSHTNPVFLHSRKRSVTAILTATWHVSGQLLHKKTLHSTPIQTLYFYVPVSRQLHLRQPSQKTPLLNSPTYSVFLHSPRTREDISRVDDLEWLGMLRCRLQAEAASGELRIVNASNHKDLTKA